MKTQTAPEVKKEFNAEEVTLKLHPTAVNAIISLVGNAPTVSGMYPLHQDLIRQAQEHNELVKLQNNG